MGVWELIIPHGTKEDYEWLSAVCERAWFKVSIDWNGHHWVTSDLPDFSVW